jgi:DNA polymerase elongation subunit (family B)
VYQAVFYDRSEKQYYLRDDRWDGFKTFQYWPTVYYPDPDGELETLEGTRVSPTKKMDNWKDTKYFEKDVDRVTRLLVDYYYESDDTPKFHNTVYLDIECEIAGALTPTNIKNPQGKITAIALYDNNSKTYYCLILDEAGKMNETVSHEKHIIPYKNEKSLLNGFLDLWIKLDPTIITGWNSAFFDMPYLYNRIRLVCGEEIANYMSPIRKVTYNDYNTDDPITIGGINHLDYMLLFKKYIVKQEPSYRLGDIGRKYAKLDKIEYQGSLDKLFEDDINKFIDYNVRDVEIIVELEQIMKFIELTITIGHLCHTTYDSIYYSTILNEGAILTYLKRKDIVSPNKPTTYNPVLKDLSIKKAKWEFEQGNISKDEYDEIIFLSEYAGGYLKDPVPGLYEWVIDLDFTSLYPSIIRSMNMGIETLVGRVVNSGKFDNQWSLKELKQMNPEKIVSIEKIKKDRTIATSKIQIKDLIEIIEKNDLIISAPGVMFRKDKSSVVCEILSDWFAKRQEYKALMKKAYKVDNDPVMGEFYNKRQHAYKIKLNDVYGVFAVNSWRYTDGNKFISKAITLSGQRLLQESIINMNDYINKQLGNTKPVDYIVTSDTDSLFIQCKDLLIAKYPDIDFNNKEDVISKILIIATELQLMANKFIGEFSKEAFNLGENEPHYFELKQEVVLDRGYFAGKRRYAQHIVNKEGVTVDELDVKGLDLMKSNFPPLFKKFGEHLINEIMFGKPKEDIDKQILEFRTELRTIDWRQILKPTGLKKMGEYIASSPRSGEIFSRLGNKCPINTKSAIFTNDLLRFKGLDKNYPVFQIGDKIYIVYLKNNPYRIDVMALNGYNDAPELLEFAEKYIDRDGLFDGVLKNKLESLYNDLNWGAVVLNQNINKFFKF